MYSSDHGTRVNVPMNDDAMGSQSSSVFEVVQAMKGHVDGFARGLNTLMKILDNEDDLMSALGVTDEDGGVLLKQIKRDEGMSIFEELSKCDSAQSLKVAAQYAERSEHILEMVNDFFRCFETHDDTKKTLTTHRVNDGLETLSIRCNEARDTICTPITCLILDFHE